MLFAKIRASLGWIVGLGLLTLLINVAHFRLFPVRVVLYDSMLDIVIAGAVVIAIAIWRRGRASALSAYEVALSIGIGALLCAFWAISVPTVIDRSLSIYILEKLDQRGGGIRLDAMPDVFRQEYMPEHRLVDIRMTEQLNSGTIVIRDGCVALTPRGRRIAQWTRFYRTMLLPKQREILGSYGDSLTDPFRNSAKDVTYQCKVEASK